MENSKALHIVDLDGAVTGTMSNLESIRAMTAKLDSPVQVAGGIRDLATVNALLTDIGIARVVLTTSPFEDLPLVRRVLDRFGPQKIAVGIDVRNQTVYSHGRTRAQALPLMEYGTLLRAEGVERVVVTNLDGEENRRQLQIDVLTAFTSATGFRVTVSGYVWGYPDLKLLQGVLPRKIDSLILTEPFYENAFPCQRIWRIAERAAMETGMIP